MDVLLTFTGFHDPYFKGLVERVLFLVDREQLAKQAIEAIQDILNQNGSYWLRPGMVGQEQQITVCLLQTMISRYSDFTSGNFDVVIADECHRFINGAWQTALTHFDTLHIGLTATPSAYIECNTFQFHQCRDGQPDFAFPILQAFQCGYLAPYKFVTGITVLLAEGAEFEKEIYWQAYCKMAYCPDEGTITRNGRAGQGSGKHDPHEWHERKQKFIFFVYFVWFVVQYKEKRP